MSTDNEPVERVDVHEAIRRIIGDLPGIGKDSEGSGVPYKFRGIEQIKTALKPLLAEHGVHYTAAILDVEDDDVTVSGKPWRRCRMRVRWMIYGPDGFVTSEARGEGLDNSDKASNKAMTVAEKQMLLSVFAIADASDDPDFQRHEIEQPEMVVAAGLKGACRETLLADGWPDDPALKEALGDAWSRRNPGTGPWPMSEAEEIREDVCTIATGILTERANSDEVLPEDVQDPAPETFDERPFTDA